METADGAPTPTSTSTIPPSTSTIDEVHNNNKNHKHKEKKHDNLPYPKLDLNSNNSLQLMMPSSGTTNRGPTSSPSSSPPSPSSSSLTSSTTEASSDPSPSSIEPPTGSSSSSATPSTADNAEPTPLISTEPSPSTSFPTTSHSTSTSTTTSTTPSSDEGDSSIHPSRKEEDLPSTSGPSSSSSPTAARRGSSPDGKDARQLLEELIASEAEYGRVLGHLVNDFSRPYLENSKMIEKVGREAGIEIWYRVNELHALHVHIFSGLQTAFTNWPRTSVSSLFVNAMEKLGLFVEILNHHSFAINELKKARKSRNFTTWLKPIEDKHGEISRLLSAPHRRVDAYIEFLKDFAVTDKGKEEADTVNLAFTGLMKLQSLLTESKEYGTRQTKLMEIESRLDLSTLQGTDKFHVVYPTRVVVREGALAVVEPPPSPSSSHPPSIADRGMSVWRATVGDANSNSYFFLFNDVLLWTVKVNKFFSQTFQVKQVIYLYSIVKVQAIPDSEEMRWVLELCTQERGLLLKAASESERNDWVENINYYAYYAKQHKIFGLALDELMVSEREYGRAIPRVIENVVEALRRGAGMLDAEGIFRIAGSAALIKTLSTTLDAGETVDYSKLDVHTLAGILKYWMRTLPEPVTTFNLYDTFVNATSLAQKDENAAVEALREAVSRLPAYNKFVLHYLAVFLAEVAQHSNANKMVPSNIAIVFGPNLFGRRGQGLLDCGNLPATHTAIKLFLLHHDRIFEGVEAEREQFIQEMRQMNAASGSGGAPHAAPQSSSAPSTSGSTPDAFETENPTASQAADIPPTASTSDAAASKE